MRLKIKAPTNYHLMIRLTFIFFIIQFIVRIILLGENAPAFIDSMDILLDGFLWDLYAGVFLSFPLFFLSVWFPSVTHQFENTRKGKHFSSLLIWALTSIWVFVGFCELNFWNEFHSRFNFIAVDYLIYTNEVIANINESFPMNKIYIVVAFMAGILTYLSLKLKLLIPERTLLKKTTGFTLLGIITPLIFINVIGPVLENHEENFREDQLSRNGWVEFVRAYRSNQIDYKNFYVTVPEAEAKMRVLAHRAPKSSFRTPFQKKPNIIMIVVESLGAKFIGSLGGQENTTPFLNKLSEESIFFTNLYATGTRTVRGLEAINLSVPPTPGYAVVKRPDHKKLFSLGHTFVNNGFEPVFIYGGRGFFDNMNSFFTGNGFSVIDQNDFNKDEVQFKNAWGVCDEDLFTKALNVMDHRDSNKPALLFLLTTSNHRPFTYPDGKIDIPSGDGRAGAVKYTDFAIGKFLNESKSKAWFKDTVFVIIADHSTEGRGQFDLEMTDFHIPMWIYSPEVLKSRKETRLLSQIDLLPSLIDLLDLKDDSPFFGQSFFNENWTEERAFVGNYQYVGHYTDKVLTTLGPNQAFRSFSYDPESKIQRNLSESPYLKEAASYYQFASQLLDNGEYKTDHK